MRIMLENFCDKNNPHRSPRKYLVFSRQKSYSFMQTYDLNIIVNVESVLVSVYVLASTRWENLRWNS